MTIAMDSSENTWRLVDQFNRVAVCESGQKLSIGRDGCDVLLKSKSVEPQHALVEFDNGAQCLALKDLATQNGTFVNEQRIPPSVAVHLGAGDTIRFGYDSVVYHVECKEEGRSSQSPRVLHPRWPSEGRRSSDSVPGLLSNGVHNGSPTVRRRRRSVQEEDSQPSEETQADEMHRSDASPLILVNNNNAVKEMTPHMDEEKESEEEKEQKEVLEKEQKEEETEKKSKRANQAFIIDLNTLPASPSSPRDKRLPTTPSTEPKPPDQSEEKEQEAKDSEKEGKPLSRLLPDKVRRSIKEREERQQAAREAKEKEKEEKEKLKEKERLNGSVKGSGGPALTDSRRRSSSNTRPGSATRPASSSRPASATRTRQRSASKGRSVDRDEGNRARVIRSTPGGQADDRRSRSDHVNPRRPRPTPADKRPVVALKKYPDTKSYLLDKMLSSQSAPLVGARMAEFESKVKGKPAEPKPKPAESRESDEDSGPSEAGTYTIENERPQEQQAEADAGLDTSGPLQETQEALCALERRLQAKDEADTEVQTVVEDKRRSSAHHLQQNGGLIYNVLSGATRTPSEHGSDAEHSPTSARSTRKPRDGSAVRRSHSDTHKTTRTFQLRRQNAMAASAASNASATSATSSTSSTSAGSRRRMSTGNSAEASTAAASSGRDSAPSGRKGSNPYVAPGSKPSPNLNRFDFGRFSLKSQSQSVHGAPGAQRSPRQAPQQQNLSGKREALRRRKDYDPRKAVMESKRRGAATSESEGQASPDERPRRTNSADARPVTEMESPRAPPARRTGAAVRRHESFTSAKTGRLGPRTGVVPNTESLLGPGPPASAFLDVRSPCGQRSQSVSNAACSEVAYDLLLVSSIHVMTGKLRRGFDELFVKLREQRVFTRTPTPIHELFQSKPPAHLNSTNTELKEALADLRVLECGLQTLESHLLPTASDGAVSARTTALGGCTETEYQQELRRINSDISGFVPIGDSDDDIDDDSLSQPAAVHRPVPVRTQQQPLESSF